MSCEPTVVICGSQYVPGRTPWPSGKPHALPTIFWAKLKPFLLSTGLTGRRNSVEAGKPRAARAFAVKPRPTIKGIRPPARTSSRMTGDFNVKVVISLPFLNTFPSYGRSSISSPIFIWETSNSIGNAPESSIVLKKIGAILVPKHTPPKRLFGTNGISWPVHHRTEFVADLRDEPVPTTSPT